MARLLLLDNYDSFTWNLAHYLEELGATVEVRLNDEIAVGSSAAQGFDAVVLSPGPGRPEEAGVCLELIRAVTGRTPVLGVCLGHQALALAQGASIVQAPTLMHGKTSPIDHGGVGLFRGLRRPFQATRYHSLIVARDSLPVGFDVTAWTDDGVIMGLGHEGLALYGVQFHPESVLTAEGKPLLSNFLRLVRRWKRSRTPAA